jgi:Glucose / Sorbosone dehydrogenase
MADLSPQNRSHFSCAITACLLLANVGWAQNLRTGVVDGNIEVLLDVKVSQALDPATEFAFIDLVPFPDGTGRLAVSTIQGGVRVIDADGNLSSTHLLTKAQTELVLPQEAGLTGIAFHPDFNHTGTFGFGKFYTITTEKRDTAVGGVPDSAVDYPFGVGEDHQDVIREWDLAAFGSVPGSAANNAFTGGLVNSRELLRVDRPGPFHNMVDLTFNTNAQPADADYGLLYITSGDGGNGLQTSLQRAEGAQNLGRVYGKVLRIDPDPTAFPLVRTSVNTGLPAYSIPTDNPFNGDAVDGGVEIRTSSTLAEIWAYGVRSPWRLNFDRANGKLYLGDVGESAWEEVDVVEKGKNYGWGLMEGKHDGTLIPGDGTTTPGLTLPIIELPSGTASDSITGGFVYRGTAIPELLGKYVFADLGQGYESGAVFYAVVDPGDVNFGQVREFKISPVSPRFENNTQVMPERIFSIGEDANGELYLVAGPDPRQPFVPSRPSLVIRLVDAPLFGDLTFDEMLAPDDWTLFKSGQGASFNGVTRLQGYQKGDMDGDFDHDLNDFLLFRSAYIAANGATAFDELLAQAPEPTGLSIAALALLSIVGMSRRRRS